MSNKQKTTILIIALLVVIGLIIWSTKPKEKVEVENIEETAVQMKNKARESLLGASFIMPDTKEVQNFENGVSEFSRGATNIRAELGEVKIVEVSQDDSQGGNQNGNQNGAGNNTANNKRTDLLANITITYNDGKPIEYLGLYTEQDGVQVMKSIALIAEDAKIDSISTQVLAGDENEEYLIDVAYEIPQNNQNEQGQETVESRKYFVVENGYFNLSKTDVKEQGKD